MRRFVPLLLLFVFTVTGFVLVRGVGWDSLARNQDLLVHWVGLHPILAAAVYLTTYIVAAATSAPYSVLLTVAGGLLFGPVIGCILTVVGATTGAAILLIVLRPAFGTTIARYMHHIPSQVQARLARDGFSYLLALRLVPLFPFWVVNLAAAFAGIRLAVFVPATLIGIMPASFIVGSIGAGVGGVLAEGRQPDLSIVFTPRILLALLGLASLSLLPVLLRRKSVHA